MIKTAGLFWIKPALSSAIALLLMTGWACRPPTETLPEAHRLYLEQKAEPLPTVWQGADASLDSLEPHLAKRVFLIGEMHGVAYSESVFFNLFRSLTHRMQVVNILAEISQDQAILLNRYLESGDETHLHYLFNAWSSAGAAAATLERYRFYQEIHRLNQSLPAERGVRFWGVDIAHQGDLALFGLNLLIEAANGGSEVKRKVLVELRERVSEMKAAQFRRSHYPAGLMEQVQPLTNALRDDFLVVPSFYQMLLGERNAEYAVILDALERAFEWYQDRNSTPLLREEAMYDHFLRLFPLFPESVTLVGKWGNSHVIKASVQLPFLAQMLDEYADSPVRGGVLSVFTHCIDSLRMDSKTGNPTPVANDFEELLRPFGGEPASLFLLNAAGSPFFTDDHLVPFEHRQSALSTVRYFDLMLIVSRSPASTKWH